ncbi:myeloid leukemia factor 1 isoform X2 [Saccopteryx leptura]|uniref:myeloid leukemia factor 1 isoform X2 n=1 Tax=Saccopteryx leptura TaxID=249018 RepID=UPI00339C2643
MGKQIRVAPRLSRQRLRSPETCDHRAGRVGPARPRPVPGCSSRTASAARDSRMFRMLSNGFEDDPFFSAHRESMLRMVRSFSEPFGRDLLSISNGRRRTHDRTGHDGGENALTYTDVNPFQSMDHMMLNMQNSMQELQRNFDNLSVDPHGHSFTSSSVMTYSKVGDEPPKVFQASTQTRQAPGGIKETRKTLRDSDSGLEKISVGHHLHDRAHVIKKSKNKKTGDEEVNQEFINMNESDAHAFDDEWRNEILKYKPGGQWRNLENTRMPSVGHENSGFRGLRRREKSHPSPVVVYGRRPDVFVDKLNIKGAPVKISKK